ncbi:MAG: NAD-dependent epimerase/dehydratase family protein, partial [Candidatus Nanohaloarchaea archaeon]
MKEKSIVTGAAGFIGSHLTEELLKQGKTVVGIDNFHPYYSEQIKRQNLKEVKETAEASDGEFRFVEGSILKDKDLDKLPSEPDKVFHNAAVAGVRNSIDNPAEYAKQNILGLSKLLDSFDSVGKFVFASSSSVYGMVPEDELPAGEDRELDPIAPYPLSKKQGEEIIRLYSELYNFDYSILRYFTVYGPRQRPDEAFTKFIKMVLNNEPVTIYGDGEQSRDFTHVKDIARGAIKASKEEGSDTYNLGSQRRITVNEMVEILDKVMTEEVEKTYVEQPEGDARHTHANIQKAREKLDYRPQKEFEEGARECV